MLARLLIHEPRWVVIDEVLDAIDGETRTRALEILSRDLKDAAIIHIGRGKRSRCPRSRASSTSSRIPRAAGWFVRSPLKRRACHRDAGCSGLVMGRAERVSEVPLDAAVWSPVAAGEARLALSSASAGGRPALRLDFDFKGGAGFVVARCPVQQELYEDYTITFRLRGVGPTNHLELKLVDSSGQNVWRHVQRESAAARALEALSHRQPRVRVRLGSGERRRSEGSRSDRARHRRGRRWRRYVMGQRPQDRGSRSADWRDGRAPRAPSRASMPIRRSAGPAGSRAPTMRGPGSPSTSPRRAGSVGSSSIGATAHRRAASGCEHRRAVGVGGRCTRRRVQAARAATSTCRT